MQPLLRNLSLLQHGTPYLTIPPLAPFSNPLSTTTHLCCTLKQDIINFEPNDNHYRTVLTTVIPEQDKSLKSLTLGSKAFINDAKFKLEVNLNLLPTTFSILSNNDLYIIDNLSCHISGCCKEDERLCWCDLISNIDQTGKFCHVLCLKYLSKYGMSYNMIIHASLIKDDLVRLHISFEADFTFYNINKSKVLIITNINYNSSLSFYFR